MVEKSEKSSKNWFWAIWAIVLLATGIGLAACQSMHWYQSNQRTDLSDRLELEEMLLSLRQIRKDWDAIERQLRDAQAERDKIRNPGETRYRELTERIERHKLQRQDLLNNTFRPFTTEFKKQENHHILILFLDVDPTQKNSPNFREELARKNTPEYITYVHENTAYSLVETSVSDRKTRIRAIDDNLIRWETWFFVCLVVATADLIVAGAYLLIDRWTTEQAERLKQAEERFEAAQAKVKNYSWNIANANLEKYYQRNFSESQIIFRISVSVMVLSFAIIIVSLGIGLLQSSNAPSVSSSASTFAPSIDTPSREEGTAAVSTIASQLEHEAPSSNAIDRQSIGFVGVIAGIVTNFIGATFMVIYRMTNQQATRYSEALERINDVGMAMDILHSASDSALSEPILNAKVEIATKLIERSRVRGDRA
ncbi:TRADD-N-associated membrane domain-containing protein [Baaleninema simplex]|uniref:TRADD-N-associated membrane domain-containing protein n=1 Tax=Baaleninema simplex TaxID=2862350 RepID=UPI00034ACE47|nr:hypothetical protein [Baaleninema simplex]